MCIFLRMILALLGILLPAVASTPPVNIGFSEAVSILLSLNSGRVESLVTSTTRPTPRPLPSILRKRFAKERPVSGDSNGPTKRVTRSTHRVLLSHTAAPTMGGPAPLADTWELAFLSLMRPRYFVNAFDLGTKLVIVQKMIDIFQALISADGRATLRGSVASPPEPLMKSLQTRVRRVGTSLQDGWEYDLDDFVYYLLSKRRIDKRIHELFISSPVSPTPDLFLARVRQRFPELEFVNKENVIDWYNNVIRQGGEVVVKDNLAVMSVRHYVRVLTVLQNELVKSVRNLRSTRSSDSI